MTHNARAVLTLDNTEIMNNYNYLFSFQLRRIIL